MMSQPSLCNGLRFSVHHEGTEPQPQQQQDQMVKLFKCIHTIYSPECYLFTKSK